MRELNGSILKVDELSLIQKNRMFDIFSKYFDNSDRAEFERDLLEKHWVIILQDTFYSEIQGFSTQMLMKTAVEGIPVKALFSGDTIIEKKYWGQRELVKIWFELVFSLREHIKNEKFYWFLISMGYRTYRFLPVYFRNFFPCYNKETPAFEKALIDKLAYSRYPSEYDASNGVIHFNKPGACLNKDMANIEEGRLNNPHIKFFLKKNRFWKNGDEFACIAELSDDNLRPIVYTIMAQKTAQG